MTLNFAYMEKRPRRFSAEQKAILNSENRNELKESKTQLLSNFGLEEKLTIENIETIEEYKNLIHEKENLYLKILIPNDIFPLLENSIEIQEHLIRNTQLFIIQEILEILEEPKENTEPEELELPTLETEEIKNRKKLRIEDDFKW